MIRSEICSLGAAMAALTLSFATPALAQPADPPIRYVVKPGDNLFTLGNSYLLRPADYEKVQRANHVADPRHLRVGSIIVFDTVLLKSKPIEARLSAFSGAVRVGVAKHAPVAAAVGMAVAEGETITTGADAFVTFEMVDESHVTLPSNSVVRIVRLREILLTDAVQRVFALDEGRSDVAATPNGNPNSRFEIRTPLSVSAVRGTEFRVSQDGASNRSITEVVKGGVGFLASASAAETLVPQNFGVAATVSGVGGLVALLPAPKLTRGGKDQQDVDVVFNVEPSKGAAAYRLQLANDAGFVDIFAETKADVGPVTFHGVPNGTYFVRATAIDPNSIEGLPNVYSFERDLNTLEPGQPPKAETVGKLRRFLFRWSAAGEGVRTYRFQMFSADDPQHPQVDLPGLTEPQVTVTDLPPGAYAWRVTAIRFKNGKFTEKVGPLQTLQTGE
jgi:hypothetical protein